MDVPWSSERGITGGFGIINLMLASAIISLVTYAATRILLT